MLHAVSSWALKELNSNTKCQTDVSNLTFKLQKHNSSSNRWWIIWNYLRSQATSSTFVFSIKTRSSRKPIKFNAFKTYFPALKKKANNCIENTVKARAFHRLLPAGRVPLKCIACAWTNAAFKGYGKCRIRELTIKWYPGNLLLLPSSQDAKLSSITIYVKKWNVLQEHILFIL